MYISFLKQSFKFSYIIFKEYAMSFPSFPTIPTSFTKMSPMYGKVENVSLCWSGGAFGQDLLKNVCFI